MWRWGFVAGALLVWVACDPPVAVDDGRDILPDTDAVDTDGADTDSVDTDVADTDVADTDDTDSGDTDAPEWPAVPDFTTAFTLHGGCGDVLMYAANADDTVALVFHGPNMASYAHSTGTPQTLSVEFGTQSLPEGTTLEVQQGTHLTDVVCDDIVEYETAITRTWQPAGGTLDVTVTANGTPSDGSFPADADFLWAYALLVPSDDPTATPVDAGDIAFDAFVGWLPG